MAGRILGMGDMVSLVEKAQEAFDADTQAKMQAKMAKGQFTLDDFLAQMKQMQKMGPLKQILKMMPGMSENAAALDSLKGDELKSTEAIIHSMTRAERADPSMLEASRRRRIARGSGTEPQDVSGLVKSFTQAANMMKQMAGMGMAERMRFAKQMASGGMGGPGGMGKVKQRSKRLTKKQRDKKRKSRRRR
jgi:signal recognition particle subunit SRP54